MFLGDEFHGNIKCLKHPKQQLGERLIDHILLYKHDFRSVNILELVQSAEEVTDGCLLEIVISREFSQCFRDRS